MIPHLYRPTESEITAVIARGIAKHHANREVMRRMDRAAAILRDWTLYAEVYPQHQHLCWRVPSATHPNERLYMLPAAERGSYCTCPDYERGEHLRDTGIVPPDRAPFVGSQSGAPRLGSQLWCKHRMAVTAYVRILTDKLRGMLDTGALDLVILGKRHVVLADGAPVCDIEQPSAGGIAFAWHYDAASFSTWLAGQTLPHPEPIPGPDAWPPQGHIEWQPELSPAQHQRWLDTGLAI
jgi:hypothetical protein